MQNFSAYVSYPLTKPILLHQEPEPFKVCQGCPDVGKYSKHSGKKSADVIRCVDKMKEGEVSVNER